MQYSNCLFLICILVSCPVIRVAFIILSSKTSSNLSKPYIQVQRCNFRVLKFRQNLISRTATIPSPSICKCCAANFKINVHMYSIILFKVSTFLLLYWFSLFYRKTMDLHSSIHLMEFAPGNDGVLSVTNKWRCVHFRAIVSYWIS